MRKRSIRHAAAGRFLAYLKREWKIPLAAGLGLVATFPTPAAHTDLATYLAGLNRKGGNQTMVLTRSPAGSIHEVEIAFADAMTTGGIESGAGVELPGGVTAALRSEHKGKGGIPDEDRVNRRDKKGRIVAVLPVTPPKGFAAGSILDRTSFLLSPAFDTGQRMAFAKPQIKGKEIEIATAFYKKEPVRRNPGVSPVIASLVTNDNADVLATAYARVEPDYARESPFDSILKPKTELGRFVPDISPDDHAWAATPLPAEVFTAKEQKCLAEGIYFEARGEELKGQAAVAQVILNRVRNPAYPKTICGVVYQNENWRNRCQFSFACDRIPDLILSPWHWKTAKEIAMAVTAGKIWFDDVGSSTHYHATYVNPPWGRTMKRVAKIGKHIFYRTYGGGWS
ncbi:N-acetylmuramoyl-L-alanine amidase [Shinella sp. WSC3-e]|nr:Spore germination cell wall hydrolase CwlJ-like protein [Rhizobiaceae bacterium]CAK7254887.1 N-acetylmuramoyl-L-alanine amidase [Shinella sp. WSC3-e]